MTGLDASTAVLAVSERLPESALLVLTLQPDRIARLGAIDVVDKLEGADALLDKIRAIARRRSD
jgi:hypothetical protein